METAKRILIEIRETTNWTILVTPFMNIRDGHNRKVPFGTKEELGDKIDKLTVMIGKLQVGPT